MMTSAQVVEMSVSVTTNSPSQDCTHPDDHTLPTYDISTFLFCLLSGSKKSNPDLKDNTGSGKATGEQLKCEALLHELANGHLVCNGVEINSTCWTVCIEGYEKENAQIGSYMCQENGEWSGKGTACVKKDCGSLDQVVKIKNFTHG